MILLIVFIPLFYTALSTYKYNNNTLTAYNEFIKSIITAHARGLILRSP